MKNILFKVSAIIVIFFAFICVGLFINNTNFNLVAYAETEPTAQGGCGTDATWEYYKDTATLEIKGGGDMNTYNYGAAPWYPYVSNIKKIIVSDNITLISNGAFQGCNKLKEINLPFIGASRTATGPSATFGYVFGYTTLNAYSDDSFTYKGIFNGANTTCVGYVRYTGHYGTSGVNMSTSYGYQQYNLSGVTYSSIGFSSNQGYRSGANTTFYDYRVGSNTTSYSPYYYNYVQPSGTTWQYSCNDYYGGGYCTLQSYYYYIPSTLTKVSITDASKIETAAFMNCSNITEINLNSGISAIGDYAFRNFGVIDSSADNSVVSGKVLIAYKGNDLEVNIPDGIEIIAPRAFYAKKVSTVNLPESVIIIGDNAFYQSSAVVNIPKVSGAINLNTYSLLGAKKVVYLDKSSYTNGNDTFYFTVDDNENATIVGCETTSVNITLPVTLGGYTVTAVGYRGMANCTTLSAITIPNNITSLGDYAFAGCTGLDVVTVPATCTYVGTHAFSGCSSMTTAIIAEGVLYLGDYAFENCTSLTEIVVPDSCGYLGKCTFFNCTALESAIVGNSTPAIQDFTFYNCENLKTIVVGINVTRIGDYAFYNTALTNIYLHQLPNLKTIGNYAFASCSNVTAVRLRAIETIGDGAFMNDTLLAEINLPNTLKDIGAYAFYGCSSLTSVTIPALVTNVKDYTFAFTVLETATVNGVLSFIGEKAFYNDNLTTFTFKEGLTSIGADAFAFNNLTEIILPDSLTYIGEQAFNACVLLATVSLPDSISYVGAYAFSTNASDLTITVRYNTGNIADYLLFNTGVYSVIMEDGITQIGEYAFALNRNLQYITFSNTIETIGSYAFYGNRRYSELALPNTVASIGEYAFALGYNFVKIHIPDSVQTIGAYAFYREQAVNHINPEFTVELYYNSGIIANNLLNGQHIHHIIVDDYIHTVGNNAFSNCKNLIDISMPDTIALFGDDCFINDKAIVMTIRSVDNLIDDEVYKEKLNGVAVINIDNTVVGNSAFYGNIWLKTGKIVGESNIGNYAFYNCNAMQDFTIDGTIERIGEHAFDSCKSLGAMSLPITVYYIGPYAFYDCNSMPSINIPNGVENIKSHTFYGCAALQNIETPDSIIAIEDYAFYGCVVAKTITISNNCKLIGEAAFYNCKAVEELIIPDSVTSIGDYAFRSCLEVTELRFSDNIETMGASAFYDCNALESVYLGKKIIELKDNLFYGCVNLKSLYVYAPLSYIDETAFFGAYEVTVYCGRDDYMINFFEENFIDYVILDELIYEYKIVFQMDNGEIISSAVYAYGATVVVPANPTKAADNTFTYVFKSWDKPITTVGGNAVYIASFDAIYINYTVIFKNYDETIIKSTTYHYGDTVEEPSTPVKPADNTYTYTFNGWDKEVINCNGDTTYTATYSPVYIDYTVQFKNDDGTVLSSNTYHYGDTVVVPATPVKPADNTYTYSFKSWDKEVVACQDNTVYTATYNAIYIEYTVVFKNYNDAVLSERTYHYGDTVVAPATPEKSADNTFTYSFSGWDKEVINCVANATYKATYNSVYIEYTVVFKNFDNSVINSKTYHFGDTVIEPATPNKPSDTTYSYTFNGWDNAVGACSGNAEYKATFSPSYINYTVTFKNADGSVISSNTYHYGDDVLAPANPTMEADKIGNFVFKSWDSDVVACDGNKIYTAVYDIDYIDYTIVFKNYNDAVISSETYHYGDDVIVPSNPTKPSDSTFTYSFNGWDKEITTCDGDKVYTATFNPVYIIYTVIFKNYDGAVLKSTTYHYGDTVIVPANPSKPADTTYTYAFNGWDKDVINCNGNATYTATYASVYIDYTVQFKNDNGTVLSSNIYHYGDTVLVPANPSKLADNTYTYSFKSWDKEVVACQDNTVYTATYNSTHIEYTVVFKNYDDTVLSSAIYHYGDNIVVPETPVKPADQTYTYAFSGWDSQVVACDGNKTYIAQFTPTNIEYTIVFKNYNGDILSSAKYHYGDSIVVPATPSKPADSTYTYSFKSWDNEVVNCVGDATYTATYNATYIEYTVTFLNWDSSEIQKVNYHYGDTIISIPNPERENDETYMYEFTSWNKPLGICSGNTKFTAQYEATYINYTIIFKDQNDIILSRKNDYHYGDNVIKPNNPEKESDNIHSYTFKGWKDFSSTCVGNATYVPEFNEEFINYTVIFKDYNGTVLSENTYHYGDTIVVPSNPTRSSDAQYSYTFNGWDKEISEICIGDAEYTATYTQSKVENVVPSQNGGSGCAGNVSAGDSAGNIIMSIGAMSICFAVIIIRKKKRYNV
ncbi:MAG: leucine-rich repeat protein [Christensenellaceae bacterium]